MIDSDVKIWEEIFIILFIFVFAFIGSAFKSYIYKVIYGKYIRFNEIIISTLITVIIGYYIIIPLAKIYSFGIRVVTGLLLVISFGAFHLTELTFNTIRDLSSISPKVILIIIISILLRIVGIKLDIKELLNDKKNTSKPYSDIHNNTYTTINNTYNNIDKKDK